MNGAATLFGKALVYGVEGAAFTMCVDAEKEKSLADIFSFFKRTGIPAAKSHQDL
jgi:hypothetical protein